MPSVIVYHHGMHCLVAKTYSGAKSFGLLPAAPYIEHVNVFHSDGFTRHVDRISMEMRILYFKEPYIERSI